MKEASARIKINKLLEAAGWRFFADTAGPASIPMILLYFRKLEQRRPRREMPAKTTPGANS